MVIFFIFNFMVCFYRVLPVSSIIPFWECKIATYLAWLYFVAIVYLKSWKLLVFHSEIEDVYMAFKGNSNIWYYFALCQSNFHPVLSVSNL